MFHRLFIYPTLYSFVFMFKCFNGFLQVQLLLNKCQLHFFESLYLSHFYCYNKYRTVDLLLRDYRTVRFWCCYMLIIIYSEHIKPTPPVTYQRWVVRFHTIFSSFSVNLSITPLQLSTNWLFRVSFTDLTAPVVDIYQLFLESLTVNTCHCKGFSCEKNKTKHNTHTFYDSIWNTSSRSFRQ